MPSFSADLSDSELGHKHLPDGWNDCDQQPCPHALENSITEATQLRDGTPAVPIARSITAPRTLMAPPVPLALTAPPASTTVTARPLPASSPAPPLLTSSPSPIPSMSQQSLDQLMHSLIQQVAALTNSLQTNITVTTKSSMVKPHPFKGQSSAEACRFIAHFESWASEQADLKNDDAKAIKAALGFLSGGAADWATPYLSAFNAKQVLFNGKWVEFLQAFKLRFESIDPGMEACNAIKKVQQGKGQTVAEFAQKFKDIGDQSGLSDTDLQEQFYSALLPEICQNLIIVNIAQGLAQTLDEAIRRAISVDAFLHDPSMSNGFIARMHGHCYGCGSQSHEKQNCPQKDIVCCYCACCGHLEAVSQDKFMGLERNCGRSTSSVLFTLFPNEPAQVAASAPPSAASTATTPNLAVQIAQLQELLNCTNAMAPDASCQEDF
ncbi:hypothetical protein GYMLUDRAFT_51230 [Collybiopsis luxurians FD-317 M1]|uniref:Unplaced genomic scaffold GYMLUscaffold_156, whole genome shotgun sequence n=1 Tax=Collybiopsis luxurians FD-317 M1 TaxID=944289 RepID=A0A0D0C6Q2_9AGAR|nr:hypothetical protein GYMLUDRAFT_51230 [Collybiopsis luxurians FD-317 M1]